VISTLLSQPERRTVGLAVAALFEKQGRFASASTLLKSIDVSRAATLAFAAGEHFRSRSAFEESVPWYLSASAALSPVRAQSVAALAQVSMMLGHYKMAAKASLQIARMSGDPASLLTAVAALIKLGRGKWAKAVLSRIPASPETQLLDAELNLIEGNLSASIDSCNVLLKTNATAAQKARAHQLKGKAALSNGDLIEARTQFATVAQSSKGELAVAARFNEGVAAYRLGDIEHASTVWQMAAASSDSRPIQAHAEANLGSLFAETGEYAAAIERLERALGQFSRFGSAREVAMAASNLARFCIFLGDFDRASELSGFALTKGTTAKDAYVMASATLALGSIAFETQKFDVAAGHFEMARNKFEALKNHAYAALSTALKARVHVARNEKAQAEIELSRACIERGEKLMPAAMVEIEFARAELALELQNMSGAMKSVFRVKEALLDRQDIDASITAHTLLGRIKSAAADSTAAKTEFEKAARLINETAAKVPLMFRPQFMAVHRRAQVLNWASNPVAKLLREVVPAVSLQGLVGQSAVLQRLKEKLPPVGKSNSTVLIRGESGTGKEALAEAIHMLSPRKHMPLVKVNCAAMVDELLLSELFGHEKGAFTGAIRERKGRFEAADGGSIFLDEIGDISPKAQVALLRVLQEREYERVGGTKTLKADVRVICATNRDLETLITQGKFRADLYYRLKGVMLELPALRERLDDLPALVEHFVKKAAAERGDAPKSLSPEALVLLQQHHWPGNIRELENVVIAATLFAETEVIGVDAFSQYEDLGALVQQVAKPVSVAAPTLVSAAPVSNVSVSGATPTGPLDYFEMARVRDISLKDLKHEMEMQCILKALHLSDGNISEAARLLKMKRSRLSQIVNAEPQLKEVARGE
jgi:transcriptional regulator with GAF, ATPase, and Fis domain